MVPSHLYDPLPEIIFCDDFDTGLNGWVNLTPNFRQDAMAYYDSMHRFTDWGPPMLSSNTFAYVGTHGSLSGTYSMKIGTRPVAGRAEEQPVAGSMGHAIKRLTFTRRQLLRCEMWYTFKAEQDRPGTGEQDVRAFGFLWDIQDDEKRTFYGVRYMNAANGVLQKRWQYLSASEGTDEAWGDTRPSAFGEGKSVYLRRGIDPQWLGKRDAEGGGDGFRDVPGGAQRLCYNETADKTNWHYFSLTVDMADRAYVELRSVDRRFDLRGCRPTPVDAYPNINGLLNPMLWVEADTNRRAFLYVDSVVNSTGEGA